MSLDPVRDLPLPLLVAWPVGVALLAVLLVRLVRARRARSEPADVDLLAEGGPLDPDLADEAVEHPLDPAPLPGEETPVEALRAQVRTLEEALEETDAGTGGRTRVTVQALAATTSTREDPRRTLARVVGALERLEHDGSFARPVLASVDDVPALEGDLLAVRPAALRAVQRLAEGPDHPATAGRRPDEALALVPAVAVAEAQPAEPTEPGPAEPGPAEPVPAEPGPAESAGLTPDQPVQLDPLAHPPAAPDPAVVLPVPPPAVPQPRRRGRRQRA